MQAPLVACREPTGSYDKATRNAICFKFAIIPPCFVWQQYLWNIALQPSVVIMYQLIGIVQAAHH